MGCLTGGGLRAQHYVGVRAGYGAGGQTRFYPPEDNGLVWGLYSGGVSWKYYSYERYIGAVEMDVEYFQRAFMRKRRYTYEENEKSQMYYRRYINSVMVPMIWQPHFYFFQRTMRVSLNLGVTFSYNIKSPREEWFDREGNLTGSNSYTMKLTRDNRFGFGLMGGGALGFLVGRFEIMGEARYYFDYGDLLKNRNVYEANPLRSPIDNVNVSIGVYYRLGKGGILSPPSKKTAAKIQQKAERRAAAAKPPEPEIRKPEPEPVPAPVPETAPSVEPQEESTPTAPVEEAKPE